MSFLFKLKKRLHENQLAVLGCLWPHSCLPQGMPVVVPEVAIIYWFPHFILVGFLSKQILLMCLALIRNFHQMINIY